MPFVLRVNGGTQRPRVAASRAAGARTSGSVVRVVPPGSDSEPWKKARADVPHTLPSRLPSGGQIQDAEGRPREPRSERFRPREPVRRRGSTHFGEGRDANPPQGREPLVASPPETTLARSEHVPVDRGARRSRCHFGRAPLRARGRSRAEGRSRFREAVESSSMQWVDTAANSAAIESLVRSKAAEQNRDGRRAATHAGTVLVSSASWTPLTSMVRCPRNRVNSTPFHGTRPR